MGGDRRGGTLTLPGLLAPLEISTGVALPAPLCYTHVTLRLTRTPRRLNLVSLLGGINGAKPATCR